jgi:CHAD domain-containing protein
MSVEKTTPLWLAARVLLHERGDDFFRRRDRVMKTFDPEDIHDLRVSSRRLREGLELFLPCYRGGTLEPLVKLFRKVTRALGEIRNTDEATDFFTSLGGKVDATCAPDLERLQQSFAKKRLKELRRLKAGLMTATSGSLRDRYRHGVNSPALFTPPPVDVDLFAPLAAFAATTLDTRMAEVLSLVPAAERADAVTDQHRLRISVKHFRYRLEILSVLFGDRFQELHMVVKGYQEVLGRMHDLDVFAAMVRAAGFSDAAEEIVTGMITARRGAWFAEFSGMLNRAPLERIGAEVRSIGER